jgi:hypothetical protein
LILLARVASLNFPGTGETLGGFALHLPDRRQAMIRSAVLLAVVMLVTVAVGSAQTPGATDPMILDNMKTMAGNMTVMGDALKSGKMSAEQTFNMSNNLKAMSEQLRVMGEHMKGTKMSSDQLKSMNEQMRMMKSR